MVPPLPKAALFFTFLWVPSVEGMSTLSYLCVSAFPLVSVRAWFLNVVNWEEAFSRSSVAPHLSVFWLFFRRLLAASGQTLVQRLGVICVRSHHGSLRRIVYSSTCWTGTVPRNLFVNSFLLYLHKQMFLSGRLKFFFFKYLISKVLEWRNSVTSVLTIHWWLRQLWIYI